MPIKLIGAFVGAVTGCVSTPGPELPSGFVPISDGAPFRAASGVNGPAGVPVVAAGAGAGKDCGLKSARTGAGAEAGV